MQNDKDSSTEALPKTLLAFLLENRAAFYRGLTFAFTRILMIAPLPLIFQHIVDRLMPQSDIAGILTVAGLTVCLLIAHHIFSITGAAFIGKGVAYTMLQLRARIFNRIQYLSFGYLDKQHTGRLLSKFAFDTQKMEVVMMPILNSFLPDIFYSVLTLSILVSLNWQLAGVLILLIPVFAFMRSYYFARFRKRNEDSRLAYEKMAGTASELLSGLKLVRFYGEESQAKDQISVDNDEVARTRVALIRVASSFAAFTYSSVQGMALIVVAGGAILAIHGQITTGTVIAFVAGLPALINPVQMFANISDQYFIGQEAHRSVRELLEAPYVEDWKGDVRPMQLRGDIEFDAVTFRYPEGKEAALRGFSVYIATGESVALVGASGAGKSTFANLLLGLYRAEEGEIRIDGIPQSELDMRWFRRNAAIVLQESILFSGSVAENLRFARPDASDEQLEEAARMANADDFIRALPNGYHTVIGERGAALSGGQRQRLSIARALLRNPAVLVLDEPTSALDYESEAAIQTAIERLSKGRTVITIAHRLSTIRRADRILVLDQGRLIDQGSYAELSDREGPFNRLLAAAEGTLS